MLYLDTSLLIAALTIESESARIQDWLDGADGADLAVSDWVRTEFSAALSRKVRMKLLDAKGQQRASHEFAYQLRSSLRCLVVTRDDFLRGANLAESYKLGLRGGDALHLAIVERHGATLCTLDKGQADAGCSLGIDTQLI